MRALARAFDAPAGALEAKDYPRYPVTVGTESLDHRGRPAVLPTPDCQPSKAWQDSLTGLRLDLISQNRAEKTIRNRLVTSTLMARHATADGLEPADIDRSWITAYLVRQYQHRSRGGHAACYADLRCYWQWYGREFGTPSPMEAISRPAEHMPDVPVLTVDQLKAILTATAGTDFESVRNRAIIWVLIESGLRRTEVSNLDVEDVDLETRVLRVRRGKGDKSRMAVVGSDAAKARWRYQLERDGRAPERQQALFVSRIGDRLTPAGIWQMVGRVGARAGIEGLRPHVFRHSWAHYSLDSGMQEHSLCQLAGWSTTRQVARYGRALAQERALREGREHLPSSRLGEKA